MDNKLYKIVSTKWLDTMRTPVVLVLFLLFAAPMALATEIGACQDLAAPDTYTLTNNITTSGGCFTFSSSDVTLDCQGYTLTGDGTGVGIYPNSVNNILIKNCNVATFDSNYAAAVADNVTFTNDTSSTPSNNDYNLFLVTNSVISNSTGYNSITGSIAMFGSTNILIEDYYSDSVNAANVVGMDSASYVYFNNVSTNSSGQGVYSQSSAYIYIENSSFNVRVNGVYLLGDEQVYINNTKFYLDTDGTDSYIAAVAFGEGTPYLWITNTTLGDYTSGEITFPETIGLPALGVGTTILISDLNVSYNKAFVNSTTAAYLNTTATVVLNGLPFVSAIPDIDIDDDGTYALCTLSDCTNIGYSGGILSFNVNHWTSYSSEEGGTATVTLLYPDDASAFTANPDFIFHFNATFPNPKNCSLWLNKTVAINYKTEQVNPNTDTVYALNVTLSTGNWTWWVACADGTSAVSEIRTFIISVAQPFDSMLFSVEILVIVIIAGLFMYLAIGNLGPEGTGNLLRLLFMFVGIYFIFSAFSLMSIGLKESMPLSGAIVIVDSLLQITMWIIVILLIFYALRILFGFVMRDKL